MNTLHEHEAWQEGDLLYHPRLDIIYEITSIRNYPLTPDATVFYTLHPINDDFSTIKSFTLSDQNIRDMGLYKL